MAEPGWYDDPENSASWRWWDGKAWTEHSSPKGADVAPSPAVPLRRAPVSKNQNANRPLDIYEIPAPASDGVATASRALSTRTLVVLIAAAVLVLLIAVSAVATAASGVRSVPLAATTTSTTQSASPAVTPSATGPVVTYKTIEELQAVPFGKKSKDDPARESGTSTVSTPGVDGELTRSCRVTYEDGVEVSRSLVSERVTRAPIDEVTSVGTYVAPPPPPEPVQEEASSGGDCDPNYADGCVPIASDVDCAGGSGNGPAYFQGPARVVGSDIYGLDSDKDGLACE